MLGHLLRLIRRFALTLGGEILQSAFHFGLNIVLVRSLAAQDYGIFAIVMLAGGIALSYVRAVLGMPAGLYIPQRLGTRAERAYDANFGSAALVLSVLIGLVVAALLELWLHTDAVSGALFVGLWSLRSYLRIALLVKRQQVFAGASDAAFAVGGTILSLLCIGRFDADPLRVVFYVLIAANVLAIAVAILLQRQPVRITFGSGTRRLFRRIWRQLAWSAATCTTAVLQAQGLVMLVATMAGPAAYAPIAAVMVLFGPMRIIAFSFTNTMQPELALLLSKGEITRIRHLMVIWSALLAGMSLAYGFIAFMALPLLGSAIFEGQPKYLIAAFIWAISITYLVHLMPRMLMEVLHQFRLGAIISAASVVIGITTVVVLLVVSTPAWSLLGNLVSELFIFVCAWGAVLRALRARADGEVPPVETPPVKSSPLDTPAMGDPLSRQDSASLAAGSA